MRRQLSRFLSIVFNERTCHGRHRTEKEWIGISSFCVVRTPVDIRLLYPALGMAYITGYLKSLGREVRQIDLAAEMRLDLRSRLAVAECSRTTRILLKLLFIEKYPVSADEIQRDLMTPEVRHVSILPSDHSVDDTAKAMKNISTVTTDCINKIRQTKADVVGFHVTWDSTLLSLLVAKGLKSMDNGIRIVFGGPDCSTLFRGRLISRFGYVDAVVTGEGEKTIGSLLSAWDREDGARRKVKGCIIQLDGKPVEGGEAEPAPDLDSLPFPDYSDLTLKNYTAFYALPILTSRGCRYKCTFCVDRLAVWRGTYRERSIENAVKEIVHLKEKYGIKTLYFCDSSLNPTLQRLAKLCKGLGEVKKAIGEEILWGGDIRASPLTESMLRRMHEVGCRYLMFGAESASPQILRSMGKGVTKEGMARVFKWAKEAGIWVFTYWIVGYPGETGDDLLKSMRFLLENTENIDEACVAPCEIGYGSELFRRKAEFRVEFQKSQIVLNRELMELERYSQGYKAWVDESRTNTPIERLYRRTVFESIARSLGYPSNWAIWPPMPAIDRLDLDAVPVANEYNVHRIQSNVAQEEIYIESKTTMESTKASPLQLEILQLCDGARSVREIAQVIIERKKSDKPLGDMLEDCRGTLGELVRKEIVRMKS